VSYHTDMFVGYKNFYLILPYYSLGELRRSSPDLAFGSSFFVGDGEHHALYGPGIRESSNTFEAGIDAGMSYQFRPATSLAVGVGYRHLSSDGDVVSSIPANVVGGNENGNIFDARVGLEH